MSYPKYRGTHRQSSRESEMVVRRKDDNKYKGSQIRENVLEQLKQCIRFSEIPRSFALVKQILI